MASFDELDFKLRTFMKLYRYRRYDTTPHTPLQRPLTECRVALATTAGLYTASQEPFDDHFRGGDYSYREIPNTVDVQGLTIAHRSTCIRSDRQLRGSESGLSARPLSRARTGGQNRAAQ